MKPGDLVTIPQAGERIGRVLARVAQAWPRADYVTVEAWILSAREWSIVRRLVYLSDCQPAPETDRRVKAARKATP